MLSSQEVATLITALVVVSVVTSTTRTNCVITASHHDRCGRRRLAHSYAAVDLLYRQMPEIVERGHVYIAQPPCTK